MSKRNSTESTLAAVSDAITAADRTLDSIAESIDIPVDTLREELTDPDALHWITLLRIADELGVSVTDLLPWGVDA